MPTAIEKITIEGFKSIRSLDLALRPLNVMIGANGVGKSNLITVFEFLNELVRGNLQLYVAQAGGADRFLYFGRAVTASLRLQVEFLQEKETLTNAYSCVLLPTAQDNFVFAEEKANFHDRAKHEAPLVVPLGEGHAESKLREPPGAAYVTKYVREAMHSWRIYHFHDTSESARIKQTGDLYDNRFLREDAANLAAYLYWLREERRPYYDNIVGAVRMIAPFFDDFALRPSPFNEDKIRLEWTERGSDFYFDAYALSDGTLRFMSLATLLLQPPDRLPNPILLDGPELELHPAALNILSALLRSAATHTQVIAATQSVTLVNQLDPEDVIVVEKKAGESSFRRIGAETVSMFDDYDMGDLWEKNVVGGRP